MNCCSRKSLIERKGCMWGSREHGCLGYERREKEDAKNKLSALLFCHGLVQILVISSWVKQNPFQLREKRYRLMQVTLPHCLQLLKARDPCSLPHLLNQSLVPVYSKEIATHFLNQKNLRQPHQTHSHL